MAPYVYVTVVVIACLLLPTNYVTAKTVFRRRDKISENFKQLSQDEIDPNVAPVEPQKPQIVTNENVVSSATNPIIPTVGDVANSSADEGDGSTIPSTPATIVDDTANEVADAEFEEQVVQEVADTTVTTPKPPSISTTAASDPTGLSKYCKCSDTSCDCCRSIGLPILPIRGPGCAKITYLGDEKMSVSLRYGDLTLATRTVSSKRARPVCVGLPGGYSKFCGRVYGLAKTKDNFKACLGFELRADDEVEAALRVSCFKFGPEGLRVADAEPLPSELNKDKEEEDEDDFFGFGAGGDDEDEEDYDGDDDDDEADDEYDDDTPAVAAPSEAPEDADYGGFSLAGLFDDLDDGESDGTVNKPAAASVTIGGGETRTNEEKEMAAKGKGSKAKATQTQTVKADQPTIANNAETETTTPVKNDNVKTKTKKNKRKKAAAATETDLAYEILNGILDYFN